MVFEFNGFGSPEPLQGGAQTAPPHLHLDRQLPAPRLRCRWLVPFAAIICLGLLALGGRPAAADVSGVAKVIDGDTIDVAGERVRLHGIDAPESRQSCWISGVAWPCGKDARAVLMNAIGGQPVRCVGSKHDRYGRWIAVCYAGDQNLNAELVRGGWAMAYRRYAKDYVGEESEARAAARGIWRGQFVEPWEWRHGTREPQSE